MNQGRYLAFAVVYGVLAGYLFMLATGHMMSLWPGADRHALTLRIGAAAWVALILLSAWTGSRLTAAIGDAGHTAVLRGPLHTAVITLGFVTGIIVADSLLAVISLIAGASIQMSRTHMQIVAALAWLAGGATGSMLLSRQVRRHLKRNSSRTGGLKPGTDL